MSDADSLIRLGREVQDRRGSLGLSVVRAAGDAGINRGTWAAIEHGNRKTSSHIYGRLEAVLQWQSGSVRSILNGGGPLLEQPRAEPTRPVQTPTVVEIPDPDLRRFVEALGNPRLSAVARKNMKDQLRLLADQMDLIIESTPARRRSA